MHTFSASSTTGVRYPKLPSKYWILAICVTVAAALYAHDWSMIVLVLGVIALLAHLAAKAFTVLFHLSKLGSLIGSLIDVPEEDGALIEEAVSKVCFFTILFFGAAFVGAYCLLEWLRL